MPLHFRFSYGSASSLVRSSLLEESLAYLGLGSCACENSLNVFGSTVVTPWEAMGKWTRQYADTEYRVRSR